MDFYKEPEWWISTVFVALLVNVISSYVRNFFIRYIRRYSDMQNKMIKNAKDKRYKKLEILAHNGREENMHAYEENKLVYTLCFRIGTYMMLISIFVIQFFDVTINRGNVTFAMILVMMFGIILLTGMAFLARSMNHLEVAYWIVEETSPESGESQSKY